jgi:FixJ family two-component response regulator
MAVENILSSSAKHFVVVVDDDAKMRESLESLLQSAEFSVAVFSSAEDTLQSLILAEANCLVTDIRMPGMHGLELQRRVKHDFPRLPVILITGNYDEQLESRALAAGAVGLLYKPFDPSDLLSRIRLAIEKSSEG